MAELAFMSQIHDFFVGGFVFDEYEGFYNECRAK